MPAPLLRLTGLLFVFGLLGPAVAAAAPPAGDRVYPEQTVAFLSIPDAPELRERFDRTQIGQLVDDPSMAAFARHLRDEAVNQVGDIDQRLALTVDDLFEAAGGELTIGVVHREKTTAALVVTVDVTGKQAEADAVLAKVKQDLLDRGAKRSELPHDGLTLVRYDLPPGERPRSGETRGPRTVVYFQQGGLLVGVDNLDEAKRMVAAARDGSPSPLSSKKAYAAVLRRSEAEAAGVAPHARWFVDPFGFQAARSTMKMPRFLPDRKDLMTILRQEGFDAIEAFGGVVSFAVDDARDLVHRTAVYAPGDPSRGTKPSQRFRGSMRMADAPNRADLSPEPWAPRMTATYTTFNLNVQGVFDNLAPLFDEVAGYEGAFETTLEGFEKDPYGPKIKVREELIEHLGSRVTLMTDFELPVSPDCQRFLFVVEVKDEKKLRGPIDKLMESDGAIRRTVQGVSYWEVIPEPEEQVDLEGLPTFDDGFDDVLDEGLGGAGDQPGAADERHSAVCVHKGRLVVASDVEYLEQALFGVSPHNQLTQAEDFRFATQQLAELAPWARAGWAFVRNDETLRPTYELVRSGRMPESQTFFGSLINQALTTDEDEEKGIVREQRLDGATMPSFELVRRYFGPSVRAVRTDDDGWVVVGVLLNKESQ